MKQIQLTQGQVALIDDEDFEFVNQWKWQASCIGQDIYYAMRVEYYGGKKRKTTILMHRLIMKTPKSLVCDHINHNTLDNRKPNLRNVTVSQNSMNQSKAHKDNRLGILGVSRQSKGFRAYIHINKKQLYFPTRKTIEEAVEDRKKAEIKYYGEYSGKH